MNKGYYYLLAISLAINGNLLAQPTCTANSGTGNWTDASTWSCGVVPTGPLYNNIVIPAGSTVFIQNGETITFTDSVNVEVFGTLTVGENPPPPGSANLFLDNDASLLQIYTGGTVNGSNTSQVRVGTPPGFTLVPGNDVSGGLDGPQSVTKDSSGAPLPVELIYFKGGRNPQGVLLRWQTATEINNDFFEIELSTNGESFEPIARILGSGTTTQFSNYEWLHGSPTVGLNYYRLKQVDYNGDFEYFQTIVVQNDTPVPLLCSAYPSPGDDLINLQIFSSNNETPLELLLYDPNGRIIDSAPIGASEREVELSTSKLKNGLYYYYLRQGNETSRGRLLIQH